MANIIIKSLFGAMFVGLILAGIILYIDGPNLSRSAIMAGYGSDVQYVANASRRIGFFCGIMICAGFAGLFSVTKKD